MAIPSGMKALLLKHDGYGDGPAGPELEDPGVYVEHGTVEVPKPGPGQVLVRVRLAPVNPSDVAFLKGTYGQPRRKGRPAGFEGVGEVVTAGGDSQAQALVGKRVAFATGRTDWGSFAEYAVAEAHGCIPVRSELRDEDAASLIVNPLTALAMFGIVREEGAKSFVLTAGASQLSKLILGVARDEGFRGIAIVRRDGQIPLIERAGAAHVLVAGSPDFPRRMKAVFAEEEPRILLDAVTGPLGSAVFGAMGRRARWILYGRLDPSQTVIPEPGQFIFMDKRVEGFWLTAWMREADAERRAEAIAEAQRRFAEGRWATDVTAVLPLGKAVGLLAEALAKPDGKVFIAP